MAQQRETDCCSLARLLDLGTEVAVEHQLKFVDAHAGEPLLESRKLFQEYAAALGVSLEFQGFSQELSTLPGDYAPPSGRLILAAWNDQPAGCVALRKIDNGICEMKRLFIRSQFRGLRIGRALAEEIIRRAKQIGYKRMRLDTMPTMPQARSLYAALGFREIAPYRHNPVEGTSYMELDLE